jgi:F-type H+-transporting ATPase subunit delta
MKNPKLAGRYANALFTFSIEQNQLEKVYQDVTLIKTVLKENRELRAVIESPVIFPDKKNHIFSELFQNQLADITFGFLRLIITKKREPALMDICNEFISFYYRHHNIKVAQVTTAQSLTENMTAQLKQLLETQTGSTILLKSIINPEVIGGLLVKIDNFVIDASIISKINRLKAQFSQNIYRAGF